MSSADSYREVTLESNLFKILTRLLTKWLSEEIDDQIADQQLGFRRGHSCLHAVQNLLEIIDKQPTTPTT